MGHCKNVTQVHDSFPERWNQDDYIGELSHTFTTDCSEMTSRVLLLTSVDDDCMRRWLVFTILVFLLFES